MPLRRYADKRPTQAPCSLPPIMGLGYVAGGLCCSGRGIAPCATSSRRRAFGKPEARSSAGHVARRCPIRGKTSSSGLRPNIDQDAAVARPERRLGLRVTWGSPCEAPGVRQPPVFDRLRLPDWGRWAAATIPAQSLESGGVRRLPKRSPSLSAALRRIRGCRAGAHPRWMGMPPGRTAATTPILAST